jgi:hypothetical protein
MKKEGNGLHTVLYIYLKKEKNNPENDYLAKADAVGAGR